MGYTTLQRTPSFYDSLVDLHGYVLIKTKSPALALQALLTKIGQMRYYLALEQQQTSELAEVATFIPAPDG
jgi:hypothetical protein